MTPFSLRMAQPQHLLTFWIGELFTVGDCPVRSRIFSSIFGLYTLGIGSVYITPQW